MAARIPAYIDGAALLRERRTNTPTEVQKAEEPPILTSYVSKVLEPL